MQADELSGLLLIIMGVLIIFITIIMRYAKKKKCSVEIQAKFRNLNIYRRESGRVYYNSIYDYTYNNTLYYCETRDSGKPTITIYINPNNPKEIFHKISVGRIIFISLGIISIVLGLLYWIK